jgi:hypothetical protein
MKIHKIHKKTAPIRNRLFISDRRRYKTCSYLIGNRLFGRSPEGKPKICPYLADDGTHLHGINGLHQVKPQHLPANCRHMGDFPQKL